MSIFHAATAMGLVFALTSPLQAQEQGGNNENTYEGVVDYSEQAPEEIIVTGTKRNKSLQKTETSVAVVTGTQIKEQALFNVEDIILRTANVSTDGNGSLNNVSIRGVTLTGVGFAGSGATANVYVDGAPNSFNANQGAANLWDIGQVEILRGPQSTVQGRNALAGAIIIQTADPEYDFAGATRVVVGSEDNRQYSGMVTGPIIEDQLAFRVAADYREIDFNVVNATTSIPARFNEALTLRGKLLFEPEAIEGLRVEATFSYVDTEFGEFNTVNAPVPATDPSFDDFDPFGNETFGFNSRLESNVVTRGIIQVDYYLNDNWSLFALGTLEDVNRDAQFGSAGFSISRDRTYSSELRANFDYGNLSGWFGGYYFESTVPNDLIFGGGFGILGIPTDPGDAEFTITSTRNTVTENYAFFGDVTYEINEKWSIGVGGRFDWESFDDTGLNGSIAVDPASCIIAPFIPGIGGLPCAAIIPISENPPLDASYDAFLPRASVTYNIDDLRLISFGVQRGYRAGGSFINAPPGETIRILPYDPEFITNYELAFRSQWLDRRLTINANIFYSDWSDQQVSIPGPSGAPFDTVTDNIGSSELYGVEIDTNFQATEGLTFFASLGIVETEFVNFPFAVDENGDPRNPDNPEFANLAGNRFNSAPKFSLSGGFTYEHMDGWFTNWTANYTSSQFSDVTNLEANKVGSRTLVNGRIGYRTELFEIAVFATNIFDDRFVGRQGLFTVNNATGQPEPNMSPFFTVNDPRVVGVSLDINF